MGHRSDRDGEDDVASFQPDNGNLIQISRSEYEQLQSLQNPTGPLAQISSEQFEQFNRIQRPIEVGLAEETLNPDVVRRGIDRATISVGLGFEAARGITDRSQQRFGAATTDRRSRRLDARIGRSEALETVGAQNIVRSGTVDRQDATRQDLIASGRGLASSAASAAGVAANLATNRKISNTQAAASRQANTVGTTAAGAGIGFALGGPPGAVIGGSLGLLAGLVA